MIKLKILFKNKTKYSQELYIKYCNFHNETNFFFASLYNIIVVGFLLFVFVLQVKNRHYAIIFIFGLAITAFILWRILYPAYLGKKEMNSENITKQKEYDFKFYENYFSVENDKFIGKVKYKELYRVRVTNDYSYLYTDRRHSYILDNSNFTVGNITTFKPFIHKKCGWRYKYYKKEQ